MSSWELKKLSEVADIIGGATPKSDVDEYFNGDIPWITPKDLSGYKNRYISKGERNITKLGLENSSAKLLPKGAVLFTSRAPIGYVAIADNEVSTNQGFKSLVLKDGNIPEFFYYLLKHNVPLFEARATGSTFKEVSGQVVKNTELLIPSIDIQKKIVDLVSPLDEKIELNTQINQTLEQIAQTIFKSWFIDFDPVHAKANALASGQTLEQATQAAMTVISGKNTQELHRLQTANPEQYQQLWEIAEAFPSGFDEEGVPRGWEEKPLPELIDFLEGPGIRNWQYTEEEDGIKFINIRCIKNGDLSLETANKITKEDAFGKYAHFQLKEDDIVISTSGTLGRFALVRNEHLPLCLNTSVIRFRPIENKSTLAFLLGLASNQLQYELEARASGSVQRNFGPTHLKKISVLLPDFYLLSLHNKYLSTLFELRKSNLRECDLLMKTRDVLLPKLLSGEV
ncbi:MAG: restriction endonuclease subunit S [[Actinobacillus] rossii]|nr:restriction endonuclease subunit S [[Actinobacillus] rossii]